MASPDFMEGIGDLQIPDDQLVRQAVGSLRGYVYQIYQTLNAWLTLKEDEILLLEIAEDFAILTKNTLNAVQVKHTASSDSVTLKTKSVSKTVTSLWEFQQANPDKNVTVTYLTTSEIGKEKELDFPENECGLKYWSVAAREGTDIEPIRKALLTLDLSEQITDFINNATPDELREKILHRIKWICGIGDISVIEQTVREHLLYLGEQQNFTPSDSERAKDSLMVEVFKRATNRSRSNRILSRVDLLRTFEKAVSISVPANRFRELISAIPLNQTKFSGELTPVDTAIIRVGQIPLRPRVINRIELNTQLISKMGQSGSLWIYGSSGTGKTVLSQFIARQSKYDWLHVQLRNCPASEHEFRLCRVLQILQSDKIGGVILDDFPTEYAHSLNLRLSILTHEVHRMNGSIIVTSAKAPSPTLEGCFGDNAPTILNVPYLNRNEVAELIKLAGGDAKKWAAVIHSFCGFGHPQLVQARITGLQQKNWPDSEILAGVPGIRISAKEIEEERDSVRERLIAELLPNTRALLYRLTLIVGYFDRDMAIAAGEVDPKIERPGEELDILLGPWIEVLADDRFRISPLVSNSGIKTLGKPIQLEIQKGIVDQLLTRHPFPSDFLGTLLSNALISRHAQGLTWLSMAVMHTRNKDKKMMSEHLSVFPLLDTDKPLFKENIFISAILRLAQFRIAAWANNTEYLPQIAEQLIAEARMLDHKETASGFLWLVINSILLEQSLRISPRKWMPLLGELEQLLNSQGKLIEDIRKLDIIKKGFDGWSIHQFLFAVRASSQKSINELVELFMELDTLEETHRNMLLSSLNTVPSGKRIMVDSAWLAEMREGTLHGIEAAEEYRKLAQIAVKWGDINIAVECECARAVMLDEYADDFKGALASLEEAEEKYLRNVRLLRARARVYYRKRDHVTALATIEEIADAIPQDDHVERVFTFREAGVSASEMGNFTKASHFFSEACKAAKNESHSMVPMGIGLKGDQAIAEFRLGNKSKTLDLMIQALSDAEQLNPEAGKQEKYCVSTLGYAIVWIQKQIITKSLSELDFQIFSGCCSNPDPPEEVLKLKSPPFLVIWYQLAVLETMMGISSGALDELRKRTCKQISLSCELILNYYLMAKYISAVDIENFFLYLPEYVSKSAYLIENKPNANIQSPLELVDADLLLNKKIDWSSELQLMIAKDALLALAIKAACSNNDDIREQILKQVDENKKACFALRDFLDCFMEKACTKKDIYDITSLHLGCLININTNPDKMFLTSYYCWEWLFNSYFKDVVEDIITDKLVQHWQYIVEHQKFNLRQPMIAVPIIQAAIKGSVGGTAKIAKLILASEIAVKHKLNENLRSKLKKNCLQS